MQSLKEIIQNKNKLVILLLSLLTIFVPIGIVHSQVLDSSTYTIQDGTINSGGGTLDQGGGVAPFANGYGFRRAITIDEAEVAGSSNLTNFPVAVAGTFAYLATTGNGGNVTSASGFDIIFTSDSDGTTQLSHEIEKYVATTGFVTMWIKIPTLSYNTDTTFYMFYGNSSVTTSQQNIADVWSNGFAAVHHLEETTTGVTDIRDSTSNNNHSAAVTIDGAGSNPDATGVLNGAVQFDGANDLIRIPDNGTIESNTFTFSSWVKFDQLPSTAARRMMIGYKSHGSAPFFSYQMYCDNPSNFCRFSAANNSGTIANAIQSVVTIDATNWHYLVGTWDGSTVRFYANGSNANTSAPALGGTMFNSTLSAYITSFSASSNQFDGIIDEWRLATTTRSADWIVTEYNNQRPSSTFLSIGTESTGTGSAGTYSALFSIGTPFAGRIQSTTYSLNTGFPEGIQSNVPIIRCAETNTTTISSTCLDLPNTSGMQGECGTPGCYNSAKFEIDPSRNPIDTLYLVEIRNITASQTYYLQSDLTLSNTYDINDYLTICQIQGKDTRAGSDCENSGDTLWDATLQSRNIYNLNPGDTYEVRARALRGDFTETSFSPAVSFTLEYPSLTFDIDLGTTSSAETSAPHNLPLGALQVGVVSTSADNIWLDLGTNIAEGLTSYIRDQNNGLSNGSHTIPSETENLATDLNSNGGFGIQIVFAGQSSLGILQKSAPYDLTSDNVGSVSTTPAILFYTDTTGGNVGQIGEGRGGISVKATRGPGTPGGTYTNTLTFTLVANL